MEASAIRRASGELAQAWRNGERITKLEEASRPRTIAEGHAVQDALIALLGEEVAGWKVAGLEPGKVMRGAVLQSRSLASPANLDAATVPLLGIEPEIAFLFIETLPPREKEYDLEDVRDAVVALPAIEIVDSRFRNYRETPVLHRLCDFMSNGALICGQARSDWRHFDLSKLRARLTFDDEVIANQIGGHSTVDPMLPAVSLANELRSGRGIRAGEIVTTGTFTGLNFAKPGQTIVAEFVGFGRVEVSINAG
jgi:2-keto-4-pentenoate hydratase